MARRAPLLLALLLAFGGCECSQPGREAGPQPSASVTIPPGPAKGAASSQEATSPRPHAHVDTSKLSCSADNWCEMMSVKKGGLHAIWGMNPGNIYALWSGVLVHFDGNTWSPLPGFDDKDRFWGLHGSEAGNVWAVGDGGAAFHFDGHWKGTKAPTKAALRAVSTSARDDAWAVGDGGTLLHWDGTAWTAKEAPAAAKGTPLLGAWASGPSEAWAVGDKGTALHWNGARWEATETGTKVALGAVAGKGPNDVWATGSGGTILHWDGAAWSPSASGTTQTLYALWVEDRGNAWAVGAGGTILHWDGAGWTPSASETHDDLHGIWGPIGTDLWVVGFSKESGNTSTWRRKQ